MNGRPRLLHILTRPKEKELPSFLTQIIRMNREDQVLDPEQQKKGTWGREDISGNIKGKDDSVTTYSPIHPREEQRIKGSVLGGDNIGRETRDMRDPIPTKMSTNSTPIYASSVPTFPGQEQQPKADIALRQEEDHKRNDVSSKEQPAKSSDGLKENIELIKEQPPKHEADDLRNSERPRNTNIELPVQKEDHHPLKEQQNSFNFPGRENSTHDKKDNANIPEGIPIGDREGLPQPVNLAVLIQPPTSNENKNGKIEVDVKVSICCRCSIL
ncbi:hypothetical protein I3842_03G129900 [Carya illinoinensis]|uniref:Uncharacterized protein n=1 Tax=Carya illinoinensis TaxID=32201 RepID=A0A922FK93_CARIL|nr:hypothetical protein I3842_03G129900 [Carya illinoinensis]